MKTSKQTHDKNSIAACFKNAAALFIAVFAALHPPSAALAQGGDKKLQAAAEEIAKGAGKFIEATPAGKTGPVYVIEEYHNSRIGQIQIATMLTRLYRTSGLRTIGLEGAVQGPAPLPADKYLKAADPATRRDVLKRLLRDSEISGAEYAGAALEGMKVVGIENAAEYATLNSI